jgi:hypothetical protein
MESQAASKYRIGYAQVDLRHLEFTPGVRNFDESNVHRLCRIFATEGCHRDEPSYSIPAVLPEGFVGVPAVSSGIIQRLCLDDGMRLYCLHGKHRVLAARRFLPARDQWWTVALYKHGMLAFKLASRYF